MDDVENTTKRGCRFFPPRIVKTIRGGRFFQGFCAGLLCSWGVSVEYMNSSKCFRFHGVGTGIFFHGGLMQIWGYFSVAGGVRSDVVQLLRGADGRRLMLPGLLNVDRITGL